MVYHNPYLANNMTLAALVDLAWRTHLFKADRTIELAVGQRICIIVENVRLVCLLDLTADFGVNTNTKLTPNCQLTEKSKTGIQSCMNTLTLTPIFA